MKAVFDGNDDILSGANEDELVKDSGTVSFDKTLEAGIAFASRSISFVNKWVKISRYHSNINFITVNLQ